MFYWGGLKRLFSEHRVLKATLSEIMSCAFLFWNQPTQIFPDRNEYHLGFQAEKFGSPREISDDVTFLFYWPKHRKIDSTTLRIYDYLLHAPRQNAQIKFSKKLSSAATDQDNQYSQTLRIWLDLTKQGRVKPNVPWFASELLL